MTETITRPDEAPAPDEAPETTAQPALLPLGRNKPFQTLWAGSAASALGISVADVAYPLAILGVTRSPADAGLFAAMQTVGQIISGLPAGHLVDRRSPRMLLIVAETGRALVTALVATALIMGWLTLPLLLIAALLLGAGQPVVSAARLLMIRTVVPKEQLTRAMTQDEVRINGSELAGPPIGGALYGIGALAHAVPFLFTIGSFVLSLIAGILVKVDPDRSPAAPGQPATAGSAAADAPAKDGGMLAGVKAIWASPILRVTTLLLAAINCLGVGLSLITVVILRGQAVSSTQIGLVLGAASIGGLLGAALVRPLHKLRPGALMILVASMLVPLIALLAVPFGPWWMAGLLFIAMLGVPSVRVLVDVLILRQAPPAERGRVVAAVMTLLSIGMPAGLAVTGLLLQYLSAQTAVLIQAGLLGVAVLIGASRPEVWKARWPE
jgi:MFS family permease